MFGIISLSVQTLNKFYNRIQTLFLQGDHEESLGKYGFIIKSLRKICGGLKGILQPRYINYTSMNSSSKCENRIQPYDLLFFKSIIHPIKLNCIGKLFTHFLDAKL
jgi:hypothetical protein